MIYLQYAAIAGLLIFSIWYVSGMVRDLFSNKKNKKGCDKCDC